MNNVFDVRIIQDIIKDIRDRKKGYLTNFYSDPSIIDQWVRDKALYTASFNDSAFIFRKSTGFYHLYYCSTSDAELTEGLRALLNEYSETLFTMDIIGNRQEIAKLSNDIFLTGFSPYTSLVRMSRTMTGTINEVVTPDPSVIDCTAEDASDILNLLKKFFDPLAENIPLLSEIEKWIDAGQIVAVKEGGAIGGFLIYEMTRFTSYLRYWFVHPDHRENRIGSRLIKEYFRRSADTKRQLFWVITSNDNAIKRYLHYGFVPENLVDNIFTNSNMKYGQNNN